MISAETAVSIKALDSLRGLFSFTVLIGHFSIFANSLENDDMIRLRNNLMHSAVDGFFCMSGFIMSYCYEKKFEICFEEGFLRFLRIFSEVLGKQNGKNLSFSVFRNHLSCDHTNIYFSWKLSSSFLRIFSHNNMEQRILFSFCSIWYLAILVFMC